MYMHGLADINIYTTNIHTKIVLMQSPCCRKFGCRQCHDEVSCNTGRTIYIYIHLYYIDSHIIRNFPQSFNNKIFTYLVIIILLNNNKGKFIPCKGFPFFSFFGKIYRSRC